MQRHLLCLLTLLCAVPAHAVESVWVEGEDAASSDFNNHSWYTGNQVNYELLSPGTLEPVVTPGAWNAHYSNGGSTAEAEWDFSVSEGGSYDLWLRVSSYRVEQWVSIDSGTPWYLDLDHEAREYINLISPSIDIRAIAWVHAGELLLDAGPHTLTSGLEHHAGWADNPQVHGAVDAFCVSNDANWTPVGGLSPEASAGIEAGPSEWFVYSPGEPAYAPESILDLSDLVDAPAGTHGPVQSVGGEFVFEDGTPVRFWGVGAHPPGTEALNERQARFYRSYGINLARIHPLQNLIGLWTTDPATGQRVIDPELLDPFDRWFAALKEQGVYMIWSPFWPHWVSADEGVPSALWDELRTAEESSRRAPPHGENARDTYGYVSFVEELQQSEWAWMEALLTHENPYTGLRYVDDPALAILEIHNEDSIFFHAPLNPLADGSVPALTARLQQMWMEWLAERYSDDVELLAAWGPQGSGSRAGDSLSNPSMGVYGAWEMDAEGPQMNSSERARMGDFIRFLADTQRGYYTTREQQLRDLGFRGATVSTAWKAGGEAATAANIWTDDAMSAIDRHRYAGGGEGGHGIRPGTVSTFSHLDQPGTGILQVAFEQVEDKPLILTEWTQSPPNEWKAEIAPLYALYGMGLHGWDGSLHFSGGRAWMRSGWPGMGSYVSETPHYMGQFPALARAIHQGHVSQAGIAAARRLSRDQVFAGFDALTQPLAEGGWDPASGETSLVVPPEVFGIGRISLKIEDDQQPSERSNWGEYWDPALGTVTAMTGELVWNYGERFVEIRTDKTQGLVGFAGGGAHLLPALEIEVDTPFVSLLVTSLDGHSLIESSHMLVTALARDRQLGAAYSADGATLEAVGGPPLLLEPVEATLTFDKAVLTSVRPVNFNGVPRDEEIPFTGSSVRIDGSYQTFYYEVRTTAEPPPGDDDDATEPPGDDDSAGDDDDDDDDDDSVAAGCAGCESSLAGAPEPGAGLLLLFVLAVAVGRRLRSRRRASELTRTEVSGWRAR